MMTAASGAMSAKASAMRPIARVHAAARFSRSSSVHWAARFSRLRSSTSVSKS
jgi:hypothetical protein